MTADTSPHTLRTTAPVLDCAARLFARHGPHGLDMSALTALISVETGVDTTSLRRAFPTWFDLAYSVVLRSTRERVNGQLTADRPDLPVVERMSSLVERHVTNCWQHRWATALGRELQPRLRAAHPSRYREISSLVRAYREHVRGLILVGVAAGVFGVDEPGRAADEVLETFDSLLYWYDPGAGLSMDDLSAVYVDLVLHHHLGCPR